MEIVFASARAVLSDVRAHGSNRSESRWKKITLYAVINNDLVAQTISTLGVFSNHKDSASFLSWLNKRGQLRTKSY